MIPLLLLLGLAAFAASSRARAAAPGSAPKPPPPSTDLAKRIVAETKEIIDGKRAEYSVDPEDVEEELARARKAVELAKKKEAQAPAPAPAPARPAAPQKQRSSMTVGPVQPKPARPAAPPGTDLALAKKTAPQVAAHLKQKKRNGYDRPLLKLWQTRAGIAADGVYGRGAAAALKYFAGASAPPAFFAQGTASYTPPA